jgi:hypothetical protein
MSNRGPSYDVEASFSQHRDLRSNAVDRKRGRDQYHKYIKYKAVNRGQATEPHYETTDTTNFSWGVTWPARLEECTVIDKLPKRKFYELGLKAIRGPVCCCCRPYNKGKWRNGEFGVETRWAKAQCMRWVKEDLGVLTGTFMNDSMWDFEDEFICESPDCDYCARKDAYAPEMADIIAASGPCYVVRDMTHDGDDTDSIVSAYTDDWSEVESIASWDDYMDVRGVEGCGTEDDGDWSEVEAE